MNSQLFGLFLAFALTITIASSSSPADTISNQVMVGLDKLYKEPIKDEKLKNFPLTKIIALLSSNDGYRRSLENTAKFGEKKFIDQLHHIIDEEMAKQAWSLWDYANVLIVKPVVVTGSMVTSIAAVYTMGPVAIEAISEAASTAMSKIGDYVKLASNLIGGSSK